MKTVGQHIADLRGLIKEYSRTEFYTDQFLYRILSISRGKIIKQRLDKFVNISSDNWMRICIQLESVKSHNCTCVPDYLNCKVLRTKYKIPQVFSGRNKSRIELFLLDGTPINLATEKEWLRIKQNDFKARSYYASQVNGYIYFWNLPLNIKVAEINGLWADITDLSKIQCNDGYSENPCFDIFTSDFPLDEELTGVVLEESLRLLSASLQIIEDHTNDNNQSIR